MPIELSKPGADGLDAAVRALREWQYDGAPVQLHPGDLAWNWQFGTAAMAAAVRTWNRHGRILALAMVDSPGVLVAAATVWSAGPGRPGLLEPVGVHRGHRGHRYGTAISLAAAAVLQDLGSSRAIVCTRSANVPAVATYVSAGYRPHPEVPDLARKA